MRRGIKIIGRCLGALILVALCFVAIEHIRGRIALNRCFNELRATGELKSVQELEPKRPTDSENSCSDLADLCSNFSGEIRKLKDGPSTFHYSGPGRVFVPWRFQAWTNANETQGTAWAPLVQKFEQSTNLLDRLNAAMQRPAFDGGFDYSKGFEDFPVGPLAIPKQVTLVLENATLCELKKGNLGLANKYLCNSIRFTSLQTQPLLINQLIRYACVMINFGVTWQALQASGWTDEGACRAAARLD